MTDIPFPDLPALATDLRKQLADRAARKPDKSPFILLYAFNGTGKTRLSGAFKDIGKKIGKEGAALSRDTLYYNAFTEDLFNWDNDLENDTNRKLKLNPNSQFFIGLNELEIETRIRPLLDRYADFDFKLTFDFDKSTGKIASAEVAFSRKVLVGEGDNARTEDREGIKISRGEESIFIWCFFLAILQLALDDAEAYKWVEHVYIDDPISSLDEHNAIVVGNHLVQLYREAQRPIKTVVSTHHALFFNVLHYELKNRVGRPTQYVLKRNRLTEGYILAEQTGDTPQFYHVNALADLWLVAQSGQAKTFHFNILRTLLEKTSLFLGHEHFSACIKEAADDADGILHQRFVDLLSHGKYSMYEPAEMGDDTRDYFMTILRGFVERHPFNRKLVPEPVAEAAEEATP
ncbi:AAA family ATPase [Notoacmeibacter ruber]|uniref:Anticodon nuclease n=1 Tax=Notoacmeibacter ruber TaxID=2670375 RepID=A0A3L7JGE6_9HYPH|nr:AAA family ATPase [Notoacmeibacter ruber]RLQ89279.1 anticodon nuclease [Notoacmeibacter ruber]